MLDLSSLGISSTGSSSIEGFSSQSGDKSSDIDFGEIMATALEGKPKRAGKKPPPPPPEELNDALSAALDSGSITEETADEYRELIAAMSDFSKPPSRETRQAVHEMIDVLMGSQV